MSTVTKTFKIGLSDSDKATMQAAVTALVKQSLLDAFSSSDAYSKGDFVYYDGAIYRFTADKSAGSWDSTKVESANLNDIIDDVKQAVASVSAKLSKGDYDSSTGVGYADSADNLVATKGLEVEDLIDAEVAGGSAADSVQDGYAKPETVFGNSVAWNQLYDPQSIGYGSFSNGVYTATGTPSENKWVSAYAKTFVSGHKYLIVGYDGSVEGHHRTYFGGDNNPFANDYLMVKGAAILTAIKTIEAGMALALMAGEATDFSFTPLTIDLTQAFPFDTPTSIDDPRIKAILAGGDFSYNAGELKSSRVDRLTAYGFNLYAGDTFPAYSYDWYANYDFAHALNPTKLRAGVTYSITGNNVSAPGQAARIRVFDLNGNIISSGIAISGYPTMTYVDSYHSYSADYTTTYLNWTITPSIDCYIDIVTPAVVHNPCINISNASLNGQYKPYREPSVIDFTQAPFSLTAEQRTLRGAGSAGDEFAFVKQTDGTYDLVKAVNVGSYTFTGSESVNVHSAENHIFYITISGLKDGRNFVLMDKYYTTDVNSGHYVGNQDDMSIITYSGRIYVKDTSCADGAAFLLKITGATILFPLATPVIETLVTGLPESQVSMFVEKGGIIAVENPNAGYGALPLVMMFFPKDLKGFVEGFGEAIGWSPERIQRLANLSFTPEYVNITLNPSPTGAYARAQVYNATFTIVISAALTGTPNGSITFQDSEVDLSGFETKPAEAIYDMDGKKVSEEPTTVDCNIASFVGRSKNGVILWSLLHSGVNKVKIHIEEAVPLDPSGNGKIDCRASLIL